MWCKMCDQIYIVLVLGVILAAGQSFNEVELDDVSVENLLKPRELDQKPITADRLLKLVPDVEDISVESLLRPAFDEEIAADFEPREFLTSWKTRRHLRKILNEMPCGWPQYGIPPLEPYTNDNLTFTISNNYTNSYYDFQPLRIDGLSNMDIDELVVGLTLNKVYFDFNFVNITATGKFNISTLIDMGDAIGSKLAVKAKGLLNFGLENLRVSGSLRYKLPFLFGSAKIYNLRVAVSLGDVHSQLKGTINSVPITKKLNRLMEKKVLNAVNSNDIFLSSLAAQLVEPRVNAQLKGKKLWDAILWTINDTHATCVPADLETDIQNLQRLYF